jgi:hypothetical protein
LPQSRPAGARGIELDPCYVDVAIKRWQDYSGKTATLVTSGQTFEEVAEGRASSGSAPVAAAQTLSGDLREAA